MTYTYALERGEVTLAELFPLYSQHYAEMKARLEADGHKVSPFNPQLDRYIAYWQSGQLLNFVARCDGKAVGYANIYVTVDMHNGDPIATEDLIYVTPGHRNGVGRKLAIFLREHLRGMGIKRLLVTAATDLRAGLLYRRLGCKEVASAMVYYFD